MSVGTYLCKLLHLYFCNINEIELIFYLEKTPNYWEVSKTKAFTNLKNHLQTYTKWFIWGGGELKPKFLSKLKTKQHWVEHPLSQWLEKVKILA